MHLLIVEDDASLAQILALHFEDLGWQVATVQRLAEVFDTVDSQRPDLVLLDQKLPDGNGISVLTELRRRHPEIEVIMMTGQHDLELAIEAIKAGAADFVHKPIRTEELQNAVDKALARRRTARVSSPPRQPPLKGLIGRSEEMLRVSKEIALCAGSSATVLISGESGTGKELVARLIHQHSGRSGPFVAVNCATLVGTLLESELFGHEKGAFTGAVVRKPGKFELAAGGTLFLDEIGELAPELQAKLLRALQEHSFERVGGTETLQSDARVIAATHRDLLAAGRKGAFREDLAYRLSVLNISLPALRERRDDIPLLAEGLLARAAKAAGVVTPILSDEALAKLRQHDWPGNVRELENVLTQAIVHARGGAITPDLIRLQCDRVAAAREADHGLASLEEVEAAHIALVLGHTGWHKGRSCEILRISRPALDRKILKYGLKPEGRER